jgi:hypothetical protein
MFTFFILLMLLFVSYRLPGQGFRRLASDVTGIDVRNDIRESDSVNILTDFYLFNGGGVGVGDIDNDGLHDIVFTSTQQGIVLYRNLGGLRFQDVSAFANLVMPDSSQNTGVLVADLNGDGLLDVYISRRYRKNRVFINSGGGVFRDETESSPLGIHAYSTQASQIDYDRDGDLDLFLVNSGEPRRRGYVNPGVSDMLLRNDGAGRYTDVTKDVGITDRGYGLSASVGDFNDDGWPDIYVANDFEERDKLWFNRGNGTFEELAAQRLPNMSWASMGSDVADINSDGLIDVVTVDMLPRDNYRRQTQLGGMSIYGPFFDSLQRVHNTLQLNRGGGRFINIGYMAGMAATDWSWSILAHDFNLDTDVDLFVTNGMKRDLGDQDFAYNFLSNPAAYKQDVYKLMPSTRLRNFYFENRGADAAHIRFDERLPEFGLGDSVISNGAAYADLDNDGDMELIISNTDTLAFIYLNLAADPGDRPWCGVELRGSASNPQGIGSDVRWYLTSDDTRREVSQECYAARGFQSCSDTRLVIGLAPGERVDSVVVQWSDATVDVLRKPGSKQYHRLEYAKTRNAVVRSSVTASDTGRATILKRLPDSIVPYRHRENAYDDFKRERLAPYRFSKDGPAVAVGDINGDLLHDLITAGAKYQPTQCFLQQQDGTFAQYSCGIDDAAESEDIDLALVDVDNDKDLDLIVVTGGSEFDPEDTELHDRVYLNDGRGNFKRLQDQLATAVAGSCIATADVDADGDIDLFIGGRVVPGQFPLLAPSALYVNVGGRFVDATDSLAPGLRMAGMTTSALWVDIDNDRDKDLVVVGEWMTPRVWKNTKGRFTEVTSSLGLDSLQGWWTVVRSADIDGDGDQDLLLGNNGTNCLFVPTPGSPLRCFAADFDENGSIDPIICRYTDGNLVPTRGRATLIAHMPTMTRKFTTYASFARATLNDLLTADQQSNATQLIARTFQSGVLRNMSGKFVFEPFPDLAQAAPIKDMMLTDVDADNDLDIIAVGNTRTADGDIIGYDGGMGLVMRNNGSGRFSPLTASESGIDIHRESRRVVHIPRPGHGSLIGVTTNSSSLILYLDPIR